MEGVGTLRPRSLSSHGAVLGLLYAREAKSPPRRSFRVYQRRIRLLLARPARPGPTSANGPNWRHRAQKSCWSRASILTRFGGLRAVLHACFHAQKWFEEDPSGFLLS